MALVAWESVQLQGSISVASHMMFHRCNIPLEAVYPNGDCVSGKVCSTHHRASTCSPFRASSRLCTLILASEGA